jgi:hypothetical protein
MTGGRRGKGLTSSESAEVSSRDDENQVDANWPSLAIICTRPREPIRSKGTTHDRHMSRLGHRAGVRSNHRLRPGRTVRAAVVNRTLIMAADIDAKLGNNLAKLPALEGPRLHRGLLTCTRC